MEQEKTKSESLEQLEEQPEKKSEELENKKELSSMPITRNYMIKKNLKTSNRFGGRHIKQNINKRKSILSREKKLRSIGWSILFLKG